jgi:glutamate carboxypeptidase
VTFLADLQSLVECESPSEDLSACQAVVELAVEISNQRLSTAGKILQVEGRPVFWWGAANPKVVLLAHLDTVWPIGSFLPLWSIAGDVIRGPGVFDMKAGFLQAIYALREIPGVQDNVALVATTDEELGSQTSREFIKKVAAQSQAVLVLEAALEGKVKTARKGTAMYQICVQGRASHAGLEPEKGINATTEMAHQILKIIEMENPDLGTTVVPTVLKSGTTTNTVPAEATLDIDIRSFFAGELLRVDTAIQALQPIHSGASLTITGGINRPPLEFSSTQELYAKLEAVADSIGQAPIGHASVGGASDGNFAAAAGAKVLDGLGAIGSGAHAPSEQVLLSSIQDRIALLTAFIKELIRE